jgi:ribosomal protein S18 acetylase RimI-like enzyme
MKITEHPLRLDEQISDLICEVDRLNFSQYKELKRDDLIKIFNLELNTIKERNYNPKLFLATEDGVPSGLITIENLQWDTTIFGIKMGRFIHVYLGEKIENRNSETSILLNHIVEEFRQRQIQHISIKRSVEDWPMIKTLQEMGFMLMDTLVDYSIDLRKDLSSDFETEFTTRFMKEEDAKRVIELCGEVYSEFKYDRFHREALFRKRDSTNLYLEWMKNQIYKDADEITIAERDGEVVGFSTLEFYKKINEEIKTKFANIVISGIAGSMRGRNVFPALVVNHLKYARKRDIDIIKTTTHADNLAVQKSLIKLGFKPSYIQHTFHKVLPQLSQNFR